MSTPAQIAANFQNAQRSTGPRTPEGKAASSQNALQHGLTSKSPLLPDEDPDAYAAHCVAFLENLKPAGPVETSLVEELAATQWRLNRVPAIEANILSYELPDFKALNNISLYACRLKRQYSATLKEFRELAAARLAERKKQLDAALEIRMADLISNRPIDKLGDELRRLGFDFSDQEMALEFARAQRHIQAYDLLMNPAPQHTQQQTEAVLGRLDRESRRAA